MTTWTSSDHLLYATRRERGTEEKNTNQQTKKRKSTPHSRTHRTRAAQQVHIVRRELDAEDTRAHVAVEDGVRVVELMGAVGVDHVDVVGPLAVRYGGRREMTLKEA